MIVNSIASLDDSANLSAFPMKAVIICDDLAFAVNAASTLTRVGSQAGISVQWTTKSWPMKVLKESASAQQALVEALDTHLILFSEIQTRSLPVWVFEWLGRWAVVRTVQDAAVGVIQGEIAGDFTTPAFSELSRFARKHGLNFIAHKDLPAKNPVRLPVRFPSERELGLPQTYLAGLATCGSYRGFGINE